MAFHTGKRAVASSNSKLISSFSNRLLDLAFGPLFRIACESLIGAFRQRADEQFGRRSRLPPSTRPS